MCCLGVYVKINFRNKIFLLWVGQVVDHAISCDAFSVYLWINKILIKCMVYVFHNDSDDDYTLFPND